MSVGSVGGRDDNVVDTVRFENSQVENSDNGEFTQSLSLFFLGSETLLTVLQVFVSRRSPARPVASRV